MQELQNQIDELKQRIEELESRKPLQGPRGPAGPIDAAVRNAEEVSRKNTVDAISQHDKRVNELHQRIAKAVAEVQKLVADATAEFEKTVVETKRNFYEGVENEIAAKILGILQEYHLLDENHTPSTMFLRHEIGQALDARGGK
ncbi:MAG: hypothetical protein WAK48_30675 [Candidatus Acidiferrum sp.]|jgi:hypothetical protein